MPSKLLSMQEAVAEYVRDGMSVANEGFTAFICFAAGHELIRQRCRDLTLIRMTPDLVYDQMIAAGVARKLVFSYLGNPGVTLEEVRASVGWEVRMAPTIGETPPPSEVEIAQLG